MPDSFVTVDERVVLDEGKSESSGFGGQVWIEILPTERHPRLGHGRFQRGQVPKCRSPTGA
jgi:hypothetical protein